jgi:hypothetical protein
MNKTTLLILFIFLSFAPGNTYAQDNDIVYTIPQKMIRLCNISYVTDTTDRKKAVTSAVQKLGMSVVWGPEELFDDFGVSYSSMYLAYDPADTAYTVVIRGTNYESLKSWIGEDFQVHKAVKFNRFVKAAPSNAKISKGTCIGMDDLIKLKQRNNDLVDFLKKIVATKPIKGFYLTGHSLGGTLTPPFYAYLCYEIFGGKPPSNIISSPYSFAGLTAGDSNFNNYLQNTFLQSTVKNWRFVNPLDVAPNLWDGGDSIKTMYTRYNLKYEFPESDLLEYLIYRAKPNKYRQPPNCESRLATAFNWAKDTWISQAEYQHHSYTYISLVDSCCAKKN